MRPAQISEQLPVTREQLQKVADFVALPPADIVRIAPEFDSETNLARYRVHTTFGGRPYAMPKSVIA
ncbi:hypothetical protein CLV30_106165 [Haloactinopolyspora alba]|uniref:Uncharacterized protein n=1 Tax=Haloactinopolyspora alba TaxID=648780 RepID=A0A2P8E3W5_9ACTN|nr:hypothetical protein [Haloactinopolyspora alba]PSL04160.1 hypothetical protein CLV30_106165 [Haloactinopolyspora alba]